MPWPILHAVEPVAEKVLEPFPDIVESWHERQTMDSIPPLTANPDPLSGDLLLVDDGTLTILEGSR
jgi:hypothetical protein